MNRGERLPSKGGMAKKYKIEHMPYKDDNVNDNQNPVIIYMQSISTVHQPSPFTPIYMYTHANCCHLRGVVWLCLPSACKVNSSKGTTFPNTDNI